MDSDLFRDTLSVMESTSQTIGYRVRLRMQHILKDVAQLAYERPQFFADVPPPSVYVGKGKYSGAAFLTCDVLLC